MAIFEVLVPGLLLAEATFDEAFLLEEYE